MFENEYASKDLIPTGFEYLYKEVAGGKMVLKTSAEIKTSDDVARVQEALRKEREDHATTQASLSKFGDLDPDTTRAELDKIAEYKAAAEGKLDDAAIDQIVETRITSRLAPVQRELDTTKKDLTTAQTNLTEFQNKDNRRSVEDLVRDAGTKANLTTGGLADALFMAPHVFEKDDQGNFVTKDGIGVTPGLPPEVWLTEMQPTRSHWWPASQGGGSTGGTGGTGGTNPFSAENWNMTEQGKLVKADASKAEQMAKSAGTTVGGGKPPAKK